MKKILLSLILGAALVGCGGVEPQEAEQHTLQDGRDIRVSIRDEVDSSHTPLARVNASMAEPGTVSAAATCWVTLEWCDSPNGGGPECSGTSGCSIQRVLDACGGLIESTC